MKEEKVLYQISVLEKMVGRECLKNNNDLLPSASPTQIKIMVYILDHPEKEIYQNDLEDLLHLRRATVSGVLHTMERHGLIKRVTSKKDHRIKQIIVNKKALDTFDQNKCRFAELEEVVKKDIDKEELDAFLVTLRKMQDNLNSYSRKETEND